MLAILTLGCTSGEGPEPAPVDEATTLGADENEEGSTSGQDGDGTTESSVGSSADEYADSPSDGTAAEPVRRVPENTGTEGDGFWIGWVSMVADRVELTWAEAEFEGDQPVLYRLHRVPSIGTDVSKVELTETNLIYAGENVGYVDSDVEPETFYTYLIVAESGTSASERRWTETLTVDDTTPPSDITGLRGERTEDGILLSWDQATDEVEFASYSVSVADGDDLTYIGGGADETQTSFVDTEPPSGSVTYAVQAVDFHNNRSDLALVTVE